MNPVPPNCPNCGDPMVKRKSKFRNPFFWGCRNYPQCSYSVGAHKASGEPMGTPADPETRQWRIKAHEAFDKAWKEWGYTRTEAYELLGFIMKLPKDKCHIAMFDIEQCKKVIEESDKLKYGEVKTTT